MKASEQRAIVRRAWDELYSAVHPLGFLDRRDLPLPLQPAPPSTVRTGAYVMKVPSPSR